MTQIVIGISSYGLGKDLLGYVPGLFLAILPSVPIHKGKNSLVSCYLRKPLTNSQCMGSHKHSANSQSSFIHSYSTSSPLGDNVVFWHK